MPSRHRVSRVLRSEVENIDELEERIADLEEEVEVGSHSAKEEKSV